jgi:drug/metabolite transporter (DMT)-like permease
VMWASGSFASPRVTLPRDPLVSTGWQMLLGGAVIVVVGLSLGEAAEVDPQAFSVRSVVALAYLIVFGSWLAFTAYAWLLQNAPISKVSTYAYVNPVVAIVLGFLILDEVITPVTVVGAAIIVVSVALVVRLETRRRP